MMSLKAYSYTVLAAAVLAFAAAPAFAEPAKTVAAPTTGPTIAIIDLAKVIDQSDVGKDVDAKIKAKKADLKKEADGYEAALRTKEQSLIKEIKALDPKNPDDRKKAEEKKKSFDEEILKKRQEIVKKNTEIEKSKFVAVKEIQSNIAKVAADIADERKIQVVLDRQAVLIAIQGLDITDEALKRLNAKIKTLALKTAE